MWTLTITDIISTGATMFGVPLYSLNLRCGISFNF